MQHIHFGAGRLGLGLAVAASAKTGLKPLVYNRVTDDDKVRDGDRISPKRRNELLSKAPVYLLESLDPSHGQYLDTVQLQGFATYNPDRPPTPTLVKTFLKNEPYLVTTALGSESGYDFPAQAVARALARRHQLGIRHTIYLMTFENNIRVKFFEDNVRKHLKGKKGLPDLDLIRLQSIDSIADRICLGLSEAMVASDLSRLIVMCEPYNQVHVDEITYARTPVEQQFSGLGKIWQATTYLDMEIKKKLWLLNGTHGLVALLAMYDGKKTLPDFFNLPPKIDDNRMPFNTTSSKTRTVVGILQEFGIGLRHELSAYSGQRGIEFLTYHFDKRAEELYRDDLLDRFKGVHDIPKRIVHQFIPPTTTNPDQISVFLNRFGPRVAPAMERYINFEGVAPTESTRALLRMLEMIEKRRYRTDEPEL